MSLAWPWLLLLLPLPLLVRRLMPPLAVPRPALTLPAHLLHGARPAGGAGAHHLAGGPAYRG